MPKHITPYEFGRFVKIAIETGGFGEYLGQGFDSGVRKLTNAMGLGNGIDTSAFTGKTTAAAAPGVAPAQPAPPPGSGFSQPRTADPVWPSGPPAGGGFSQPRTAAPVWPSGPPAGGGFSQPPAAAPPANPGYTSTAELEQRKRQEQLDRMAAGARMAAPQ
jgi:hypothetical protein